MATIQRPLKEGSVRTYQEKVALNFKDILASEADADHDTMYAAWNAGVDTVNVKDGSITFAKLAPDAQLWRDTGTALTPGTNFAGRVVAVPGDATTASVLLGSTTAKGRVQTQVANPGGIGLFANRYWPTNAQDDATKPSWGFTLSVSGDTALIQRSPPGSTAQTGLLTVDNVGNVTAPNRFLGRAYAVQMDSNNVTQSIPNNSSVLVTMQRAPLDSWGMANVGSSQIVIPAGFGTQWVLFCARTWWAAGGLTQCWMSIDWWNGSAWSTQTTVNQGVSTFPTLVWLTAVSASQQWRVSVYQNSGSAQNVLSAWFGMAVLGAI